jgi:hypothetical protein
MKAQRRYEWIAMALLLVTVSTGAAFAQDQNTAPPPPPADVSVQQGNSNQAAQQQDPPGRVARLEYMSGQVSMQPGGVNDWVAASQNRPLTTSDRVWTDKNSRAELNVGDGYLRMNSETSLTLTNVSNNTVQLELDQGILSLTVRHLERGEIYEVDTPNYAFTVMKPGVYRFDVYPNEDQSWVTVRSGYGVATGSGPAVRVNSGTQMRFRDGKSLQHTAENAPARDGFDDWAMVRDKRLADSVSARYVSPGVIGYQDLDGYGSWTTTPGYGPVWTPYSVPAGWAPYRFGNWAWVAPWGWTWVDDAPWGFAPFHYGRWVYWNSAWAWAPGPMGYWNPYYAPALVGWVGGPGFGMGIGFGWGGGMGFGWGGMGLGFGWYPLGWGMPYYPRYCGWGYGGWYRGGGYVTPGYFRNVNVTNTNIGNINNFSNNYYHNNFGQVRNINPIMRQGGVTSASRAAFTSGAAVNKVGGRVPASALNNAHLLNTASVNPTRQSVLGGRSPLTHGLPPASATNRNVVTSARPGMRPASFDAANRATTARTNSTSAAPFSQRTGSASTANRPPFSGQTSNGRVNSSPANVATSHTPSAVRGPASSGAEARLNTPTSLGGSYVPRPPSAGGYNAAPTHNVPRPPAGNNAFARPNGATARPNSNTGSYANNRGSLATSNQRYGTGSSQVPRPSQSYSPFGSGASRYSAPSGSSTPGRSAPQSNYRGSGSPQSRPTSSVPRPPAGYSYHPAPVYSASSNYGAGRSYNSYGGANRSSYAGNSGYSGGRGPYGSTPSYSARSYGSSPAYSPRSYSGYSARSYSAPSYSGRSMGSYSAPRYSGGGGYRGGGGGFHGGGGGFHGGGGGGFHGGGGGHGR